MSSGYYIPLPEEMADKLDQLPLFTQRVRLEHAIHKALDSAGWPRGERGEMPIPCSYWYVTVSRFGELRGHVGPIADADEARRCAKSWRQSAIGTRAKVVRNPVGPALTNNY